MGFAFPSPRPPSFPTGSFLLRTHAEVRQAGAVGAPITAGGWGRGEAGLKPKAGDQMWALPMADVFCLTCTALETQGMFQKSKAHIQIRDFWFLLTK